MFLIRKQIVYYGLSLLYFILITTTKGQESHKIISYPTVLKKELKNFSLQRGVTDTLFKMTDGTDWNMYISIPEIKDQKVPLVIALHWAGNAQTYQEFYKCLIGPAFKDTQAIIIAPSSDGLHWIMPNNKKRVVQLVKQLIKYWPIEDDKVLITGYSNGGIGSWQLSEKYPKLFTALVPMAESYNNKLIKVPVYAIHGMDDELFPIITVTDQLEQSREKGSSIQLYKLPCYSHYQACAYADKLKEVLKTVKEKEF